MSHDGDRASDSNDARDAERSLRADNELGTTERAMRRYLLGVVMPLWIASGSIDYVLHRREHIERNAGVFESSLHAGGIALSAVPVLGGLLLEIDAGVILAMLAGYTAHLGMTIWDVAYADEKRTIVPLEQHVHGMLEMLPFTALSLVLCAHADQALALVGRGRARPDFSLRFKRVPLDRRAIAATVVAFGACVALPYAEELWRCVRYERTSRGSSSRSSDSPSADARSAEARSVDASSA